VTSVSSFFSQGIKIVSSKKMWRGLAVRAGLNESKQTARVTGLSFQDVCKIVRR
jgi:hypothetical protein